MNTAYVEDLLNYEYSCLNCHIEHEAAWDEMWKDYYGSI